MKRRIERDGELSVVRRHFFATHGYEPNLDNPQTFGEKLAWIKCNVRDPMMTTCADKYAVRQHVASTIGEKYLMPLLRIYEDPKKIQFEELPVPFVLKVNHGSGANVFCLNKDDFRPRKAIAALEHYLSINAYYYGCEWAYKDIPPKVICEKVLLDEENKRPKDYKIFCFNSKPLLIQVDVDRFTDHRRDFYDDEWRLVPVTLKYPRARELVAPPANLDCMLQLARQLSAPFDFARVDFYEIAGRVYFGEITFYPEGGCCAFSPIQYEIEYGRRIRLRGKPVPAGA
jgi:hypothetical protein